MKYLLLAWLTPLALFWGWFFLSLNDINFGTIFFSRALHEVLFELYGQMLGLDPATIPWLIAKACLLDTSILLGIWAFRRRKDIIAWVNARRGLVSPKAAIDRILPAGDQASLEG